MSISWKLHTICPFGILNERSGAKYLMYSLSGISVKNIKLIVVQSMTKLNYLIDENEEMRKCYHHEICHQDKDIFQ